MSRLYDPLANYRPALSDLLHTVGGQAQNAGATARLAAAAALRQAASQIAAGRLAADQTIAQISQSGTQAAVRGLEGLGEGITRGAMAKMNLSQSQNELAQRMGLVREQMASREKIAAQEQATALRIAEGRQPSETLDMKMIDAGTTGRVAVYQKWRQSAAGQLADPALVQKIEGDLNDGLFNYATSLHPPSALGGLRGMIAMGTAPPETVTLLGPLSSKNPDVAAQAAMQLSAMLTQARTAAAQPTSPQAPQLTPGEAGAQLRQNLVNVPARFIANLVRANGPVDSFSQYLGGLTGIGTAPTPTGPDTGVPLPSPPIPRGLTPDETDDWLRNYYWFGPQQ